MLEKLSYIINSVAEPPLFWALAPDGQGAGADSDSGSDLLGSAVALAPYTKNFHFKRSKS